MNKNWEVVRVGDVCSAIGSGGTPKSTEASYYGGGIPWLNTKEVNFNRIRKTEKTISQAGLDNSSAKWIKENSVVIAMYGATAGRAAIAKIPLTTNQACCNLTIDSHKANYQFVYYSLVNAYPILHSMANGGAQQNLNAQQIKAFNISLPNLEIQNKIASVLENIDSKIEVNNRINDYLI